MTACGGLTSRRSATEKLFYAAEQSGMVVAKVDFIQSLCPPAAVRIHW